MVIRFYLLKGFKFKPFEPFIERFGRPMEVGLGAMNFFIGALITILFFSREYAAISVIVLGVSDGFATIMGFSSKHKLYETKTFEGTTAFFVSSFLIIYLTTTLFQALLISIILALIELIAPVDDNVLIPPTCALLLHLTS
jgi:dolichol kinase